MLHIANSRLPVLILGITFALSFGSTAIAESRVVFQSNKEDVKKACDNIEGGVPVKGEGANGFGCYNPNNGVLVACADNGACTGYLPKGAPRTKALGNILNFGVKTIGPVDTKSLGSGEGGGGGDDTACGGPDGCIQ